MAAAARRPRVGARWRASGVDVTLPGRRPVAGSLHPVTLTRREMERIFREMGFTVETGPEVEDDFHNFQALNLPPDHPARDATDTFYLQGGPAAAHPHLPGADPHHGGAGPAHPDGLPGTRLPARHGRHAPPHVPPARGAGRGRGRGAGRSQGDAGRGVVALLRGRGVACACGRATSPSSSPAPSTTFPAWPAAVRAAALCKGSGWIELGGAGMVHPAVFEAVGIDAGEVHGLRLRPGDRPHRHVALRRWTTSAS